MIRGILGKTTIAQETIQEIIAKNYNLNRNQANGAVDETNYVKISLDLPDFPAIDTDASLQNFSYKSFLEQQFQQTMPPRSLSNEKINYLVSKRKDYASLIQVSQYDSENLNNSVTKSIFYSNDQFDTPQKKKIFEEEESFNPFAKESSKEYQFMEITNCRDFEIVKKYLKNSNNDVNAAIANYFAINGNSN